MSIAFLIIVAFATALLVASHFVPALDSVVSRYLGPKQ